MLGLSWTELMVIGVVALIVIGPKDLPIMMRRIGEFAGQVRRMGSEFQRELQRAAAIDELKDLRKSVTDPIRQANAEITSQFNKITPGGVQPSGVLAPTDPKAESVVDAIKAQAGMTGPSAPVMSAPVEATSPVALSAKASPVGEGAVTNPAFALSPPPKVKPTPPPAPESAAVAAPAEVAPEIAAKPKRARKPKATVAKAAEGAPDAVKSADVSPVAVAPAPKPVRARRAPAKSAAASPTETAAVAPTKPARKPRSAKVV